MRQKQRGELNNDADDDDDDADNDEF